MKKLGRAKRKILKAKARRKREAPRYTFTCGRCETPTRTPAGNWGGRAMCPACAAFWEEG